MLTGRVDSALNLIKGGGACHLREKVIAAAAREFVVVADDRKRSDVLGTSWKPVSYTHLRAHET